MSSRKVLTLRYGVTVSKVLCTLCLGAPPIVADLLLKPLDFWLGNLAKDRETRELFEKIRRQVLEGLEPLLSLEGGKVDMEAVASAAAVTLEAGFSFESLVENQCARIHSQHLGQQARSAVEPQ